MKLLFVHQNYPGQWKHLAPFLASDPNNTVLALAMHKRKIYSPGVNVIRYAVKRSSTKAIHPFAIDFESQMIRAEACGAAAARLKAEGFTPDVICCHGGWGESLLLKEVWPKAKLIGYHEYHYRGEEKPFETEFAPPNQQPDWYRNGRLYCKNAGLLLDYERCDWGLTPTQFQWSTLPEAVQARTSVIHDGVDTTLCCPNPNAVLHLKQANLCLRASDRPITYVNRSLEPTRGFHRIMRCLPAIQKEHPERPIVIVGHERSGYGAKDPSGKSYKQILLEEIGAQLNHERLHFVGALSYSDLIHLFQISAVHLYYTVPFVLSWSLLEAMACGALVVGSNTTPVREVIQSERNGLLVDYFNDEHLVTAVSRALNQAESMQPLRTQARQTITTHYALEQSLKRQRELVQAVAHGQIPVLP